MGLLINNTRCSEAMKDITNYPLCWPAHKPRTKSYERKWGRFKTKHNSNWSKPITLHQAIIRVNEELNKFTKVGHTERVDMDNVIFSTDLKVRLDGKPRSGQPQPNDPGVAVYFTLDGDTKCIPIDVYISIEQNMAAVAAVLSALRSLERHDSGLMEAAFVGFDALPGPPTIQAVKPWYIVLNVNTYDDHTTVKRSYYALRSRYHSDNGGDTEKFIEVKKAWDTYKEIISK